MYIHHYEVQLLKTWWSTNVLEHSTSYSLTVEADTAFADTDALQYILLVPQKRFVWNHLRSQQYMRMHTAHILLTSPFKVHICKHVHVCSISSFFFFCFFLCSCSDLSTLSSKSPQAMLQYAKKALRVSSFCSPSLFRSLNLLSFWSPGGFPVGVH